MRKLLLLVILLTACSPAPSPTSAPTIALPSPTATAIPTNTVAPTNTLAPTATPQPTAIPIPPHPLSIEAARARRYEGSDLKIEQTLPAGSNYSRYVASYQSDGFKIFGLLTIPTTKKPERGFPMIVFNHGFIPPNVYRTTERYVAYQDAFARAGYITFKSDYRGHGSSEGSSRGGYGNNDYTTDVMNALGSLKRHPDVDVNRIGMWGHSMGGYITLRAMVLSKDIKAGVIWAGVVASYPDLIERWRRNQNVLPSQAPPTARRWRDDLIEQFGTPQQNPKFWDSISANAFLNEISGPVQLQHASGDHDVPIEFSEILVKQMNAVNKPVEYFRYEGDDHNIAANLGVALQRSVQFFDKYLK